MVPPCIRSYATPLAALQDTANAGQSSHAMARLRKQATLYSKEKLGGIRFAGWMDQIRVVREMLLWN
jgi:hypothetical protein